MYALYITHPQIRIDPDVPVPEWGLSDIGLARSRLTATLPWVRQLRRIVSSNETKAVETAEILGKAAGLRPQIVHSTHENDRWAAGFLPPAEFEKAADWFFANPEQSFKGWERATDAQIRIVYEIDAVLARHDPQQPIAFVGHGSVGTLLLCHLGGCLISRDRDQPGGGGNLYGFSLADRRLACDWTPMETWQGWMK